METGHGLKSHPTEWISRGVNPQPLVQGEWFIH